MGGKGLQSSNGKCRGEASACGSCWGARAQPKGVKKLTMPEAKTQAPQQRTALSWSARCLQVWGNLRISRRQMQVYFTNARGGHCNSSSDECKRIAQMPVVVIASCHETNASTFPCCPW